MASTVWRLTISDGKPRVGDSDIPLELFFDGLKRIVFVEDRKDLEQIGSGDLGVALGGAAGRTVGALKRSAAKLHKLGAAGLLVHERVLDADAGAKTSRPEGPFPLVLIGRDVEWPDVLQPLMRIDTSLRGQFGNVEIRRADLAREILENEGKLHVDAATAAEIGLDLSMPRRVIYLAPTEDMDDAMKARLEEAVAFHLLDHDAFGTVISDGNVLVAIETMNHVVGMRDRLATGLLFRARTVQGMCDIAVGTGSYLEGSEGLFRSLREARWSAQVGLRLKGPNHVMAFDDLGSYAWLEPIAFDLRETAIAAIETIVERDLRQGTRLLETLQVYLETRRLKEASDRLFIHRNTLRYRLDAISRLTGHDVQDPDGRLVLELQLRLAVARGLIPRSGERVADLEVEVDPEPTVISLVPDPQESQKDLSSN
ncbi:MAG: hypothetical protein QOG04_1032 [Actinomycetota bacterium]|jgi:hypothetical protein|nr:hypothetical protein [Actinomycetota bacterium]